MGVALFCNRQFIDFLKAPISARKYLGQTGCANVKYKEMVFEKFKVVMPNESPYVNYLYSGNMRCTHMEKDWMKCAERVGMSNTSTMCKEFLDDYKECVYGVRHYERSLALKKAKAEKNIEPPGIPAQYQ